MSTLNGPFWVRELPSGGLSAQLGSALLPEWQVSAVGATLRANAQATHYVQAEIPAGSRIFEGPAGPQVGQAMPYVHLEGGAPQVFVNHMPPNWLLPGISRLGND